MHSIEHHRFVRRSFNERGDLRAFCFARFAKTDASRQLLKLAFAWDEMAWPFMAPPGVPADRAAALKAAFVAVMQDPNMIAEAKLQQLDLTLVTGPQIEAILADVYATPQPVIDEMRSLLQER